MGSMSAYKLLSERTSESENPWQEKLLGILPAKNINALMHEEKVSDTIYI